MPELLNPCCHDAASARRADQLRLDRCRRGAGTLYVLCPVPGRDLVADAAAFLEACGPAAAGRGDLMLVNAALLRFPGAAAHACTLHPEYLAEQGPQWLLARAALGHAQVGAVHATACGQGVDLHWVCQGPVPSSGVLGLLLGLALGYPRVLTNLCLSGGHGRYRERLASLVRAGHLARVRWFGDPATGNPGEAAWARRVLGPAEAGMVGPEDLGHELQQEVAHATH